VPKQNGSLNFVAVAPTWPFHATRLFAQTS
jgi:hypothetical protein